MSHVEANLRYTKEHEWIKKLENGNFQMGITDYAQSSLGDIVFVDIPAAGTAVKKGSSVGTIESVKAVSDIYSPIDGTVVTKNDSVCDDPAKVNSDPYKSAWFIEIKASDNSQWESLMNASEYESHLASVSH